MCVRPLAAMILVLASGVAGSALELREAWRFPGGEVIASPTLLRPADNAPITGIVFTVADGRLVCVEGSGEVAWIQPIARFSHTAPSVGDVDGDGEAEVVALDADGVLHCFAADGAVEWTARLRAGTREQGGAGLYDLDGDGVREIVVGDGAGKAWCFDGGGNVRWTVDVGATRFSMPTFADLDGDGTPEIIIGVTDSHVYCLTNEGEWLWDLWRDDDVFVNSGCAVGNLFGDDQPEVLVGGGLHHFFALDGRSGKCMRELNTRTHINSAMACADLEGDGQVDVVFGAKSGAVYRMGRHGHLVWTHQLDHAVMSAPVIADLTGDGKQEIILILRGHGVVVLDAAGNELTRARLGAGSWAGLAVGDVNNDGKLEIVAPVGGGGNDLVCLTTGVDNREGAVAWESLRGDAACTGNPLGVHASSREPIRHQASPGATFEVSEEFTWLAGANERAYSLSNADFRRLLLCLSVVTPGGAVERVFRYSGQRAATVKCGLFVDEGGHYEMNTQLLDADAHTLLQEESSAVRVDLLARDVEQAEGTIAALEEAVAALADAPADAREYLRLAQLQMRGLIERLRAARADAAALSAADKARLIEEAMSSRRRAGHVLRLSEFILSRPEAERGRAFAVWAAFPWHWFQAASAAPPADACRGVELEAYLGERENACVNVTSFRGSAAGYRFELGPVKHLESGQVMPASCFELREAVDAPSDAEVMVADALVPLNDARAVLVGPWESRQVWITLTASDLAPGEYAGKLTITSIEPFPTTEEIEVRVRVWPIELPSPGRLRFCNWGATARGDQVFAESLARQVRDHGVNVIPTGSPGARFDENGDLTGPVNFARVDGVIEAYPEAIFLFSSPQHSISVAGAERFSDKWIACYRKYLDESVGHLLEMGIGYDRFLLYPVDEASIAGSPQLIELTDTARITKQINPRIRIYANPTMGATAQGLTQLSQYVDVWAPSRDLMEREGVPLLDFFKRTGEEVWFCGPGGASRTLSGIASYRGTAWKAWHFGLTGVCLFACMAMPEMAWLGPNRYGQGAYWDVVYPGQRAIASKRYEGATDGKEDFEAMVLLRHALDAARAAGGVGAPVEAAERLLGDEAESIWQAMDALDDDCEVTTDGSATREVVERLRAFRHRVAELTIELRDLAGTKGE